MSPIIKNFAQLGTTENRRVMLEILEAGFKSLRPQVAINNNLALNASKLTVGEHTYDLQKYDNIYLIGFGKAAALAGTALAQLLGEFLTRGVIIDVIAPKESPPAKIEFMQGTHPHPSPENEKATQALLTLIQKATAADLIFCLVSGGGSALLCQPHNLTCQDERLLISRLAAQGAPIQKVNIVRKHISNVHGGNLVKFANPATLVSLIFSDVPGNDLGVVASGPTVIDTSTVADASAILKHYNITDPITLVETPKDPALFENVYNLLILHNETALTAMKKAAQLLGLEAIICSDCYTGEAVTAAAPLLGTIRPGQVMLAAGETTVTLKGAGKGGRNQELVLGALEQLGQQDVLASVASDGWDNCEAAGAIADGASLKKAQLAGLDPQDFIDRNDSWTFFNRLGDNIVTGRTGTNVADFLALIRFKS